MFGCESHAYAANVSTTRAFFIIDGQWNVDMRELPHCRQFHYSSTKKNTKFVKRKGKKRTHIRTSHNFATFDERIHFEHGSALSSRRIWLRNERTKKKPYTYNTQPPSHRSARSVLILFIFIFTHFVVNMWRLLMCIGSFYNAPRISSKWNFFSLFFLLFYYMLYLSV